MTTGAQVASRANVPPFHVMDLLAAADRAAAHPRRPGQPVAGQPSTGAPAPVNAEAIRLLAVRRPARLHAGHRASPSCARRSPATTGGATAIDVDRRRRRRDDRVAAAASCWRSSRRSSVGDRVAMARPGYPCYRNVLTALGCEVVEIPTGPGDPVPADRRAARERTPRDLKGLVVASPANPTGTMLLPDELAALAALVRGSSGVQLISDEIYHGIEYAPLDGETPLARSRLGDLPRGGRVQLVLEVLLDDRLADRLDAGRPSGCADRSTCSPATSRSARRCSPSTPALAAFDDASYAELRRPRRAATPATGRCCSTGCPRSGSPARAGRRRVLRVRRRRPPDRRLDGASPTTCSARPASPSRPASTSTPRSATASSGSASPAPARTSRPDSTGWPASSTVEWGLR